MTALIGGSTNHPQSVKSYKISLKEDRPRLWVSPFEA